MAKKDMKLTDPFGCAKTIVATIQKNHKSTDNFLLELDGNLIGGGLMKEVQKYVRARLREMSDGMGNTGGADALT